MKVAVVGGGPSGLVAAKTLLDFGHDVVLLEREACMGGVWSRFRGYPLLRLLNTKHSFRFSTLGMPRNFDLFPTKGQVSHYLDMYIAQHNLASIMRLATAVTCMRPRNDSGGSAGWILTLNGGRQESFDHVVVCTGSCSKPCVPEIKGREAFEAAGGLCLHSNQLLDRSLLQGRRVVVVGFGQSALEVASLAAAAGASRTTLVARRVTWKLPSTLLGLVSLDRLLVNRFGEALLSMGRAPTWSWKRALRAVLLSLVELSARCEFKLGSNNLLPKYDLATAIDHHDVRDLYAGRASHEAKQMFFDLVDQGAVSIVRDATIRVLKADRSVLLSNGSTRGLSADVVIFATGYQRGLPDFVPAHVRTECALLYRGILPSGPSAPDGLTFIGLQTHTHTQAHARTRFTAMTLLVAELSALWIARHLEGRIFLPASCDCDESTQAHAKTPLAHIDALLSDLGAELGWFARTVRQGLGVVADDPALYDGVWDRVAQIRAAEIQTGKLMLPAAAAGKAHEESDTVGGPLEGAQSSSEQVSADGEELAMPGALSLDPAHPDAEEKEAEEVKEEEEEEEKKEKEEEGEETGDEDETVQGDDVAPPKEAVPEEDKGIKGTQQANEGHEEQAESVEEDKENVVRGEEGEGDSAKGKDAESSDEEEAKVEGVQEVEAEKAGEEVDDKEEEVEEKEDEQIDESCATISEVGETGKKTDDTVVEKELDDATVEQEAGRGEDYAEHKGLDAIKRALSLLQSKGKSDSSSLERKRPPSVISLSKCKIMSHMPTTMTTMMGSASKGHRPIPAKAVRRQPSPAPVARHARIQDPLGVRLLWKRPKQPPSTSSSFSASVQNDQFPFSPPLSRSSFSSSAAPSLASSPSSFTVSVSSGDRSPRVRTPSLLDRLDDCSTAVEIKAIFDKQQQHQAANVSHVGCPLVKPIARRGPLTTPPQQQHPPALIRITSQGLLEVVDSD
ncbi:hypothetical protein FA10DRAFT_43996 [Acaromyces ingoldii]|uniref:FAD/NAD(P)-binding domain-containing protein n=1 Tax=Acaromyces ingoldii TaxID=215250 RepID=A0A316YZM5_9BASI|nr:hypothetical protein FA10DRAFT_43996 [Acaromyces ingoldii]PWN94234.1 hypothetical protein FA10DRAFT_43996 [Acaromyces ingoldii]